MELESEDEILEEVNKCNALLKHILNNGINLLKIDTGVFIKKSSRKFIPLSISNQDTGFEFRNRSSS